MQILGLQSAENNLVKAKKHRKRKLHPTKKSFNPTPERKSTKGYRKRKFRNMAREDDLYKFMLYKLFFETANQSTSSPPESSSEISIAGRPTQSRINLRIDKNLRSSPAPSSASSLLSDLTTTDRFRFSPLLSPPLPNYTDIDPSRIPLPLTPASKWG